MLSTGTSAQVQMQDLTEEEAVRRVTAESVAARRIVAQLGAAEADLAAARRLPNPSVTLGREANLATTERTAVFTQVLPITGRRGFDIAAARQRLAAATLRTEDADRRIRAEVRLAFATLVAAQTRAEVVAGAVDKVRQLAAALAKREDAGDAAGYDRLRAEREVADLEAELADVAETRSRSQAHLARFFGPDVDPRSLRAVASAAPPATLAAPDVLVARALDARRDIRALDRELEAARIARRSADRGRLPEPAVSAGVKATHGAGGYTGGIFSVAATLPLFDPRGAERARVAALERDLAAAAASQRGEIRATVLALAGIVAERRASVERFRAGAIAPAAELERIAMVSYENGIRGILELLDAFRTGAVARARLADLELASHRAEIELEEAVGEALR